MNIYTTDKIRNVVLLGHGGSGKTSLTEAMAYLAGITSRMGKVTDGNTVSDYGKEEQKRQISINTSVVPIEWNGVKINILDTPGYFDFVGEVEEAVKAAGAAIIVINGKSGIEVGTEKAWELCEKYKLPRFVYVTNMDVDNASYRQIVEDQNVTENDYALVCEDDALFNSNLSPKTIALLTEKCDADIVLIGQSKIAEFDDVELEINYPTTFSFLRQTIGDVTVAYPYKSYFAGTVAYLIKKSAARAFLKQVEQEKPFWLADDFLLFETQFQINNNVVRPLVAIENPQLVSNLEAIRGSKSNNLVKKLIKYPLKKILAVKKNLGK